MVFRCVVGGCSNVADTEKGIGLHGIPFFEDDRPEARRRRKRWVDFVKLKRAHWQPSKVSKVCSVHFKPDDFLRKYVSPGAQGCRKLKSDDIGIVPYPTVNPGDATEASRPFPVRARRKILKAISKAGKTTPRVDDGEQPSCSSAVDIEVEEETAPSPIAPIITVQSTEPESPDELSEEYEDSDHPESSKDACSQTCLTIITKDAFMQTDDIVKNCEICVRLRTENRIQRNKIIDMRETAKKDRKMIETLKTELKNTLTLQEPLEKPLPSENPTPATDMDVDADSDGDDDDMEETEVGPSDSDADYDSMAEPDTETETETEEEDEDNSDKRVYPSDNLRTEPKFIVFLTQLLLLFRFCPSCKKDGPLVEARQVGTNVEVSTYCSNPECTKKECIWNSQPTMPGTKIRAGNFLLCFSILASGGSASKVFQMFAHMGLKCISLTAFFFHQRTKLFPAIYLHWKRYQQDMVDKLKALKEPLVIAGDGRHDSMGHSAKYGAYTIFCCNIPLIIHFALIQRNQAGNSPAMEYMGFQQCLDYLLGTCGLVIGTIITDRHTTIAKHMREKLAEITHYFDLWHLKKKIGKVLSKIAKYSGCEAVASWIRPCENHLYWSATSTPSGEGRVIWAKFKSFLSHMINKHQDLDDPLFNKCYHDEDIQDRQWLLSESVAYEKVRLALTNSRLVSGIKQASPLAQTSCLEGFHSVLNHFAPKMIGYSYRGMLVRHAIAIIHFNKNLKREIKLNSDGSEQVVFVYPKFKNGEATVRNIRIKQDFTYVEEMYQTFLVAHKDGALAAATDELKAMTPAAMNTMLNKQSREDALQKRDARNAMTVEDVPPTTPVQDVPEVAVRTNQAQKARPRCSVCHNLMKGHKNVLDCPKNQLRSSSTAGNT